MQLRLVASISMTALVMAACSQPPATQQTPVPAAAMSTDTQSASSLPTLGGHPDLNGIWQTMNTAYWNLEAHNAQALDDFWQMGAIAAIPAGKTVITGDGKIPYLPEAEAKRDANRANWPAADPEAKCYMLGVPRVTYHNMPFQILQGDGASDLLMVYPFEATNRVIYMNDDSPPPIDSWMGKSSGAWEDDTLVVTTTGQIDQTWLDRAGNHHSLQLKVTERFTLLDADHIQYQATMEDPLTYSAPWTIEMPLYRHIEANAQLLEHKCVPFADKLLYSDLMGLEP